MITKTCGAHTVVAASEAALSSRELLQGSGSAPAELAGSRELRSGRPTWNQAVAGSLAQNPHTSFLQVNITLLMPGLGTAPRRGVRNMAMIEKQTTSDTVGFGSGLQYRCGSINQGSVKTSLPGPTLKADNAALR